MDPRACLKRLMEALTEAQDSEAAEAAGDLLVWVLAGGAVPSTTVRERHALRAGFALLADRIGD